MCTIPPNTPKIYITRHGDWDLHWRSWLLTVCAIVVIVHLIEINSSKEEQIVLIDDHVTNMLRS